MQRRYQGLWYNPITKAIEGNAYDAGGWFRYTLDKKGIIANAKVFKEGQNQPDQQCVGAFNSKTNKVLFISHEGVHFYDIKILNQPLFLRLNGSQRLKMNI
jgi:hypothetical protein